MSMRKLNSLKIKPQMMHVVFLKPCMLQKLVTVTHKEGASSDEMSNNIHIKNSSDQINTSIIESNDFHGELFKCNVRYVKAES